MILMIRMCLTVELIELVLLIRQFAFGIDKCTQLDGGDMMRQRITFSFTTCETEKNDGKDSGDFERTSDGSGGGR